ncbi:MAG: NADH-quinone oxidoreductase subunit L [Acidobacteria bacterium]|nr:MAG: NADH-quinone oxidoreductase subunit L [Acidobacteriota bacterium]
MSLHLWVIPILCFLGFLANLLFGRRWSKRVAGAVGVAFPAAAFAYALWVVSRWSVIPHPYIETHLPWISAGVLSIPFGFQLDPLSLVMLLIITGVGLLIHIYSLGYMEHDGGFYRFFSLLNVFMFFMLVLVLANNYLLMFVGWEGVGFSSYMLIGFWYNKESANRAGMKAFITNRIGDMGFLVGLFFMFDYFHTFTYSALFPQVKQMGVEHGWSGPLTIIAILLFVGATGKSAQLPLYVWLPDAMEGPTPVSALIHAATMVTAGVYMVCRSAAIYSRSPAALSVVLAVGALTAIFAASIGLLQRDIKKVLAYSTVSQLGYMFMACGAAMYGAGVFHLMTHAFFKGLLFLGAGSVIHAMSGEQDMWKIRAGAPGGLMKYAPITFITFLIATCAISGIPFFSGFYSKDRILYDSLTSANGSVLWWAVGTIAAGMTAFYMFRALFVTFFADPKKKLVASSSQLVAKQEHGGHHGPHESPGVMTWPLMILGFLALTGGYIEWGDRFTNFLAPVFDTGVPTLPTHPIAGGEMTVSIISVAIAFIGLALAWYFYLKNPEAPEKLAASMHGLYDLVLNKYWIDEVYGALITRPLAAFSRVVLWRGVDVGLIDGAVNGIATTARDSGDRLRRQASGNIRSYATWVVLGAVAALLWMVYGGARF